jgi:predicted DNA-binding protein (UPF0251 family)
MFADYEPRPFWFASEELLNNVLGAEINAVTLLLSKYPDLPMLFDVPEATVQQRTASFTLLVHRKLMDMIYETFTGRHEQSSSLGDEETNALRCTQNLVAQDAPAWVLEVNEVVELLPWRINDALPEPLRKAGFDPNDSAQVETIKSAMETLSSIEQIRALTGGVLDQQLRRLAQRWSAAVVQVRGPDERTVSKRPLKGTEGLGPKTIDLSRYMDNLTEKQRLAFSLKFEYELRLSEIASRMGIDRKTADEHIKAAQKKVEQARSSERLKSRHTKNTREF